MLRWSIQLRLSSENHHFWFPSLQISENPSSERALRADLKLDFDLFFWFLNIFRIMHPRTILHAPGRFQDNYRPPNNIFEPSESFQTDFLQSRMWILVPRPPVKGVSNAFCHGKRVTKSFLNLQMVAHLAPETYQLRAIWVKAVNKNYIDT